MTSSSHSPQPVLINMYGVGGIGKSSTLDALYYLTKQSSSFRQIDYYQFNQIDFSAIFKYKGKTVGIMTMGDPGCENEMQHYLDRSKDTECDIIFTASRTRGSIFGMVIAFANNNGYAFIETSPLFMRFSNGNSKDYSFLNRLFANLLESLI